MTNVNTMSVADQMKAKIAEKMAAAKEAAQLKLLTNDAFQDVLVIQMMREVYKEIENIPSTLKADVS